MKLKASAAGSPSHGNHGELPGRSLLFPAVVWAVPPGAADALGTDLHASGKWFQTPVPFPLCKIKPLTNAPVPLTQMATAVVLIGL